MKRKRKNKKPDRRKIITAVIFFLIGCCFFIYPFALEAYQDYRQEKMLNEWRKGLLLVENIPLEKTADEIADETGGYTSEEITSQDSDMEIVGILKIDGIELMQPIIRGAADSNLNYSVTTLEPTGVPGEIGNFTVVGHNSRTFGRHFNRLQEVKEGDIVTVILADKSLSFTVDSIQVIEPEDMWILDGDGINSRITLITCYYGEDGTTKRLAVKGIHKE